MNTLPEHLRYAGLSPSQQRNVFSHMVLENPMLADALHRLRDLGGKASGSWLVSGALYNTIWNRLTGRPNLHGIKDLDIIYFDDSDLSWEAEDAVIARGGAEVFRDFPLPVEMRNQARVHLWFEKRFGQPYPPLRSATESIERYSTIAHCVGARLAKDGETGIMASSSTLLSVSTIFFRFAFGPIVPSITAKRMKSRRPARCNSGRN
ncbi:hypothetical protein Q644_02380 [Brucella intermedia 229E]|uniref:Nucleotidyltransferase family protein n=1 Tax=Brucella intermedia 229E TaxID=1337887 RepID=U4V802_9HYPH|nr:hypothetical protein Q644_02380 [Brucella intermedia 229E]